MYGLEIINAAGSTVIGQDKVNMTEIASGFISGSGVATFPVSIQDGFLFVRPTGLNVEFAVIKISTTNFECVVNGGGLNYRVFQASPASAALVPNYGLLLYNTAGKTVFNSGRPPPMILANSSANISNFVAQAADGGLPWMSASSVGINIIEAGPTFFLTYAPFVKYTSASSMTVTTKPVAGGGDPRNGYIDYYAGYYPREMILTN